MSKKSILIIEDDPKIRRYLELELVHEGYNIDLAEDGQIGLELFREKDYSLILLDLMLPKMSGEDVCKIIRNESNIPIIILTAKDEIFSKITLLDLGADDYITKPFVIGELLARMRVIFRNKQTFSDKKIVKFGEISLNLNTKEVSLNNIPIILTKTEYNLLHYLMINKNLVLSRENILENVWGYDYFGDGKIIDMYIKALRKKLDPESKYIKTVRGFGYSLKKEE
ncbi:MULTISPECIES: response regulator transcription factor [Cetobacterium]|uniref:Response regulator transcription factor n=1 Tax=Candidatus Cetobacterium colombiensis TaxID=3073100 RepID=A0ABU4WBE2_9FUSO|nr:response regulator transcription factor [Candidatus Cetobacterium colombiensis]MDX8336857.1 response regulator transcription factor [Candidatus Cetobacterium colombiensis]